MGRRRCQSRPAVVALAVFVLVGCMPAAPAASPPPGAPTPAFDEATLTRAIESLAAAGVAVRRRPADAPLVPVGSPSRVALLRFQARNLALEAHAGSGTLGSDLDAYATAAGSPPVTPLLLGWLLAAESRASQAAAPLVRDASATADPRTLVYPSLAIVLFLADVLGPAPLAGEPADRQPIALAGGGLEHRALTANGDFCGQITDYLAAVLAGAVDPQLELAPQWLADAIELVAGIEADPQRLRSAVAALALLAYATSISRPWSASLSAVPTEVHHVVTGDDQIAPGKAFHLIVFVGDGAIAEEATECPLLADAGLAGGEEAEAIPVGWVTTSLQAHAEEIEGDLELEERGQTASAVLEYETLSETADAHRNGSLASAAATVTAIVEREEIGAVEAVVGELLAGSAAASIVAAEYARLKPTLQGLLHPRASATVTVSWHEELATPEPTDDEFCTRYRAYVSWAEMQPEDITRAQAAEIESRFLAMEPYAPAQLVEYVQLMVNIYGTFAHVSDPYNVPLAGLQGAERIPEALRAMHQYCGIPAPF